MKKYIAIFLIAAVLLSLTACGKKDPVVRPSTAGALQVIDGKLCSAKGEAVQLKGVSTPSLPRIEKLINQDSFNEIASQWKVDIVRLAMYTYGMDSYNYSDYFKEKNLQLIERGVEYASNADMYVIIDWHILSEGSPEVYEAEAIDFFDSISAKYADKSNILYEICNEPNGVEWSTIKAYAEKVIPVIRANDPDAVIIVGTPSWSQEVDKALADPLGFENIMYTLHFYSATHKDDLRERLETVTEAGLPVFVTEYGITASNGNMPRDVEEADKWMALLDQYGISSCIWSFSKAAEAASIFDSNTFANKDFTDEDLSDTGRWFIEMLSKTYEK